jgi:sulfatase modifying factor 1
MSATLPEGTITAALQRGACAFVAVLLIACHESSASGTLRPKPSPDAAAPWSKETKEPQAPHGMVWIPDGTLIAGTPPDHVPRIADEELPGEPLYLHGFFIDAFPYPNEEGAIPTTGVTRSRAEGLCELRGKRLCTELEWERACKGPRNLSYEYGERYRPEACLTGRAPRLLPNAYRLGCHSEFGVHDLHGGVWEWTASRWDRGKRRDQATLRGGNSAAGELVGRCANGVPRAAESASPEISFRCCQGEPNEVSVSLRIDAAPALEVHARVEPELAEQLEGLLPAEARETFAARGSVHITGAWDWRPLGNVPLILASACAGAGRAERCGVAVAAFSGETPELLSWSWAGIFPLIAHPSQADARRLWVHGGDRRSTFRQALSYEWGRVAVGILERNTAPDKD